MPVHAAPMPPQMCGNIPYYSATAGRKSIGKAPRGAEKGKIHQKMVKSGFSMEKIPLSGSLYSGRGRIGFVKMNKKLTD
jgi:hypothetical protein